MRINRIGAPIIAGLLLLMVTLPQAALAAGPAISHVSVTDITETTARISWRVISNITITHNLVRFGIGGHLHMVAPGRTDVTDSSVVLTGLIPNTIYGFRIESTDALGRTTFYPLVVPITFRTKMPATYSITLDPVWGSPDGVIRVTAAVPVPGRYYICWGSPTRAGVVRTFTAPTAGVYTVTFFVPGATKGIHRVFLTDHIFGSRAEATFEVFPSVKIDREKGPVGTTVTLRGSGFAAAQRIRIKFRGTVITTLTANATGSWASTYTIPATPARGYVFEIEAFVVTDYLHSVSKYFRVTPKIAVTPSVGKVGQTVEVSGTGFGAVEGGIQVTFDGEVRKSHIFADATGSWRTVITIPPRRGGKYTIDASGRVTSGRDVPDIGFVLGAGISVEPGLAYVGDTISVAGGGFRPGETGIRVTLAGVVVAAGITARIDGVWRASFVLPPSAYGRHTVSASGDTTAAVTANLSTKARIESVSAFKGAPGDSVSLTGSGFGSSRELTVTVGGKRAREALWTRHNGDVVISFRVPPATAGLQTLRVADGSGATESVNFTVKPKTLSTPLPVSPEDGSTLRSGIVTFHWRAITGDTGGTYSYTLRISRAPDAPPFFSRSVAALNYTLAEGEALPRGTYYWQIRATDDFANESAWSAHKSFQVSPIEIPTWVWVVVGLLVLAVLMVVAYRETKFRVTE